jgi:limonene-1,2-epoxide hydrolase
MTATDRSHMEPTEVTGAFWQALYAHDWDEVASFFDDDSVYFDVPTGPSTAARGPADIVARLRLGLDPVSGHDHGPRTVVISDAAVVMTEHTEIWHWPTGETATLPFVSVQYVEGGVITMWKDYWDYNTLLGAAPPDWQERLFSADLDWIHDATGHPLA